MLLKKIITLCCFSCLLLLSSEALVCAADYSQLGDTDIPVQLEADELSYDRNLDLYRARGNVTLTQGDFSVTGNSLEWNQGAGELQAEGNVLLKSPDEEMAGERVFYNLQQGTGLIEGGHFFLRDQNLHVYGQRIERLGESDYRIYDGTFTTCNGDTPSWKFGASQLDVTLGGYAKARNMVFYLNNVPSMYFPYMVYPAKTERESGLLIPGIGYSDKRGFQYRAAYYQVLGVNQDATLSLDYLSEMGIGKGLEYRYIFGADNAGEARIYHINVDQVDGVNVNEDRYALQWQHDGTLPGQVRLLADVEYVNDNDYFSDFGGAAGEYNKDVIESNLFLNRHWGRYSLTGQFKYTQDLETEEDTTLQLLPRIVFDTTRQQIGDSSFYYHFIGQYTHFWREEGMSGERLMLLPAVGSTLQLGTYFNLDSQVAWRQRSYWGLSEETGDRDSGSVEVNSRLSMTTLEKQFVSADGAWQHLVWPEVSYQYIPEVDQDALPDFDVYDRIDEQNNIEYALVQRLVRRFTTSDDELLVRDFAYLRVGLLNDLRTEAAGQRFTDLRTEMHLMPSSWLVLRSDSTLNTDRNRWDKFAASLAVDDGEENSFSVSYRYNRDEAVEYAGGSLSIAYLKPVYLTYQQRYDLTDDYRLEQEISAEYRHQCWGVQLSVRDRDDDLAVMVSFSLNGMGSVGHDKGTPGGI